MSKQANPTVIGGFVLGAVVLLIVGVVVFGGGKIFSETKTYVLYFDENIKGLNIGAPVNLKGSRVGTITGIKVIVDEAKQSIRIPVYMTLEADRIQKVKPESTSMLPIPAPDGQFAHNLIHEQGLRAQLQSQSLVTGQLVVELSFHPDTPVDYHNFPDPHPEFPTIPSVTQEITSTIEDLNLDELVNAAMGALKGFEQLANSPEVETSIQNMNVAMKSIKNLAKNLDSSFAGIRKDVKEVLETGQATLEQAEKTLAMEEGESGRLAAKLEDTFDATRAAMDQAQVTLTLEDGAAGRLMVRLEAATKSAQAALIQARRALKDVQGAVGENSTLRYELGNTLEELSSAARSIRVMTDYLERHPEALIHGKGTGGK
jgi:paraquat-inducible protein B